MFLFRGRRQVSAHGPARLAIHGVAFPCRTPSPARLPAVGSKPVDAPARFALDFAVTVPAERPRLTPPASSGCWCLFVVRTHSTVNPEETDAPHHQEERVQDRRSRFRPRPSRPWCRVGHYVCCRMERTAPAGAPLPRFTRKADAHRVSPACANTSSCDGSRTLRDAHRERKYKRIDLHRPVREANWRRRWETSSPLRVSRGSSASQRLRPRSSKR